MKLLIFTQKVDINDDNLGSFHDWIRGFSRYCQKIIVVCLQKGEYSLPDNVLVFSLGKENEKNRLKYLWRFYRYIFSFRKNYDAVFIHMNTEYVILGSFFWRLMGKKISLWYAHGHVNFFLRLAEKFTHVIFTSSKEGCRLKSKKINIIGQGVDVDKFKPSGSGAGASDYIKIITHGRISPSKNHETLINAVEILMNDDIRDMRVEIAGGLGSEVDLPYWQRLQEIIKEKKLSGAINYVGPIPHKQILEFIQSGDLYINMSETGSLDRSVLEAMACGLPVLTSNEAYKEILSDFGLFFEKGDSRGLAQKIKWFIGLDEDKRKNIGDKLRAIVVKDHSLHNFTKKIMHYLFDNRPLDVKEIYNKKIREQTVDYEKARWFSSGISKAAYEMTLSSIKKYFFDDLGDFVNFLEVGSGAGTWTKLFLEKQPSANFDLVDISSEMIKQAKENLGARPNVNYIEKDFIDFSPEKRYDMFFSCRALEYFSDKEGFVKKTAFLLKDGGRGFIITKTPKYLRAKLLGRKISALHQGQISPWLLKKLLEKYGFKNVEIYPVTMNFPLLHSAKINWRLHKIFFKRKLNFLSQLFSESYLIKFSKACPVIQLPVCSSMFTF